MSKSTCAHRLGLGRRYHEDCFIDWLSVQMGHSGNGTTFQYFLLAFYVLSPFLLALGVIAVIVSIIREPRAKQSAQPAKPTPQLSPSEAQG
jgi:hypothetical protein